MAYAAGPGEGAADLQEGKKNHVMVKAKRITSSAKCKRENGNILAMGKYLINSSHHLQHIFYLFFFNIRTSIFSVCICTSLEALDVFSPNW